MELREIPNPSGLRVRMHPGHGLAFDKSMLVCQVVITGLIMWAVILVAYPFAISLPRRLTSQWQRAATTVPVLPRCRILADHSWFYGALAILLRVVDTIMSIIHGALRGRQP